MKRRGNRCSGVALAALALSVLAGCPRPNDPPPIEVIGQYHGTYFYQEETATDTIVSEQALITFRLTASDFSMYKDTSIPESLRIFCDVAGEYELEEGVFLNLIDSSTTEATCERDWGPNGFFQLDQTTDSVFLTQIKSEGGTEYTTRIRLLLDQ